jgi:class 3 adenylate cyclase
MKPEQMKNIRDVISESLDHAEATWKSIGSHFVKLTVMDSAMESIESSKIPGHLWVSDGIPNVDEFIAMVVDMRNSTDHLNTVRNNEKIENGFQRVYYETSALLPAISKIVSFEGGVVTEYLGDGALILFQVDSSDKQKTIRKASKAARYCIEEMRDEINNQLNSRYSLDAIDLGVGLSISKAMVTLVGEKENRQAKAIGQCVWDATKLSCGRNKINISESLYTSWPSSKGGKLEFKKHTMKRGLVGYQLDKKICSV